MRDRIRGVIFGGAVLAGFPCWAQMHKVEKPQQVVRAVAVYEWTGDMAKPAASRLIPVSLYINGSLEDAGEYLAQPIPFALLPGNVYELKEAGTDRGTLDLAYARHLQTPDGLYDDGWFGYGSFQADVAQKKKPALHASKTMPVILSSSPNSSSASTADPDRPTMKRRSSGASDTAPAASAGTTTTASSTQGSGSTPANDPDRPVMKRPSSGTASDTTPSSTSTDSSATNSSATNSSASTSSDDPDRPTMKRRSDTTTTDTASNGTTTSTGSSAGTASGSTPSDDPDRPTLKRRTPEEAKKARQQAESGSVSGVGSLNDDPNRPNLHHGKPVNAMTEEDLPKLVGLPPDLHQMVAVSDAVNRDPHEFARPWEDAAERAAILQKMQTLARTQLVAYVGVPATAPAAKPKTVTSKAHHAVKPAPATPIVLMDEVLKGYTLSYGGDPTYIYMAHTAGTGADLRYVTVVAQSDGLGELKPAIQSVTDAAHLDRTARMKFVDAVDVEASNRASLLFELRAQTSRQFALYRVIAANANQIFVSGTTQ